MKLLNVSKRKVFYGVLSGLLVFSFVVAPISQSLEIKKAEAQYAVAVVGGNGTIQETISAAADTIKVGLQTSLQGKEIIFDGIAWALINIVIKEMIRSTTQWVRSGFQGSPAFVTDLEGFLLDIADKVAGNFIYGSALSGLCSPFKLNIQLALDIQYQKTRGYRAECRLSQVVGNIESFFNGNFLEGGWDSWYNVALVSSNNPYGAKLEAEAAFEISISNAQGKEIKLLDFGKGFLSMKSCPPPNTKPGETAMAQADASRCTITTPGNVIQDQLNRSLGLPGDRLVVADEINELVGALFSQLAKEVLGGVGGLLGLHDSNAAYGGQSYFDRMLAERETLGQADYTNKPIENALDAELKYLEFQKQIVTLISDAASYKNRVYGNSCSASGALTTSLRQKTVAAQAKIIASTDLSLKLEVLLTKFTLLGNPLTATTTITALKQEFRASSIAAAQNNLMNDFMTLQNSGLLHTSMDNVTLELTTIPALKTEIATFTSSIDFACRDL